MSGKTDHNTSTVVLKKILILFLIVALICEYFHYLKMQIRVRVTEYLYFISNPTHNLYLLVRIKMILAQLQTFTFVK